MVGKGVCFAALGAILSLPVFFSFSMLIIMLSEALWRPFGAMAPVYISLAIMFLGLISGAYYGLRFALRSRGYSLKDYYRSIRDFLGDAR
jgi:ABC-type phosphate transport system permease subunit